VTAIITLSVFFN